MANLRSTFLASLLFAVAGCATVPAEKVITPAVAPLQGTWIITATSDSTGHFAPLTGSDVAVTGSIVTFAGIPSSATTKPAPLTKLLVLTPSNAPGIWNITLAPVVGQSGWTATGIARVDGDTWLLNIHGNNDAPQPTDFLPRDDSNEVISLRKK